MKTKWFFAIVLVASLHATSARVFAVPATGAWGWGFGAADPSGPFMSGYSDTGSYQENAYGGGLYTGPIQTNTWQALSYTVDNIHSTSPTITVSIGGVASATFNYGPVSTPTDIFLAFGDGLNSMDVGFPVPIFVRDLEFKLDGSTVASEPISYPSGTNLLDGTHPAWTDIGGALGTGSGIPLFVETAPGGFQAAAITDAHGFDPGFTEPDWTFPAVSQAAFDAANSMTFSLLAYWSTPPVATPEPSSLVLAGLAALGMVCFIRRKR